MQEELVTFHVIEPGRTDRPTLFEVSMIVEPEMRDELQECHDDAWKYVIGHAKKLVAQHLDSTTEAEAA